LKLGTGTYDNVTVGTSYGTRFISNANGNDVTITAGVYAVMSDAHRIVRGYPALTLNATTPDTNRLMNFKVTTAGNKVTLTGFSFTMTNGTGAMVLTIYKNSVSTANRLGTGDLDTWANNVGTFNVAIIPTDVETTMNFIVEVEGYVPSLNNTTSLTRSFKITDLGYLDNFQNGTIFLNSLGGYANMNFPLSAPNYAP